MRLIITFNNKNWPLPVQPTPPVVDDRFRLEALENGSVVGLSIKSPYYSVLQYSLDGTTWNNFTTSTSETLNTGDVVYVRGKLTGNIPNAANANRFILTTGKFAAKGNIMYLYDYEHPESTTITYNYAFRALFNNCKSLYDVSELLLPATTLGLGSYMGMFGYSGVINSPSLPATTLSESCYHAMFNSCTSLEQTPILPAPTLALKCYESMFSGASKVNRVVSYATSVNANGNLYYWLKDVSNTGDFYNLGGASYQRSINGIPSGWTVHTSL